MIATRRNHYVPISQTREWEIDGHLHYFDFDCPSELIQKEGKRNLLKEDFVYSDTVEKQLQKTMENSLGTIRSKVMSNARQTGDIEFSEAERAAAWNLAFTLKMRYRKAKGESNKLEVVLDRLESDPHFIRNLMRVFYNFSLWSVNIDLCVPQIGFFNFPMDVDSECPEYRNLLEFAPRIESNIPVLGLAVPISPYNILCFWHSFSRRIPQDERWKRISKYSCGVNEHSVVVLPPSLVKENQEKLDQVVLFAELLKYRNEATAELNSIKRCVYEGRTIASILAPKSESDDLDMGFFHRAMFCI